MSRAWYKLDNAGKLYPSLYNKKNPNSFILSAILKVEIDEEELTKALNITLKRFKTFNVKLKKGFFWYYFEENNAKAISSEETACLYQSVNFKNSNSFLFNVTYFKKRISIEIFHALTDAVGGVEFLKALCFNYLKLKGVNLVNDENILTSDVEISIEEFKDSFTENFDSSSRKQYKSPKAYEIKGDKLKDRRVELIHGYLKVDELKVLCKNYDTTITEYLGGVLLYSIYKNSKNSKLPISIFIPINARKHLGSKTLRNFVLYIRSSLYQNEEVTIKGCIDCVKNTLKNELTEEHLKAIIRTTVPMQEKFMIRIVPLFVKEKMIKVAYRVSGLKTSTICFSNLGEVSMSEELNNYIDRFEFSLAPCSTMPISLSGVSYNNNLSLSFAKSIKERNIIKTFFNILSKDIEIILEVNDLEG